MWKGAKLVAGRKSYKEEANEIQGENNSNFHRHKMNASGPIGMQYQKRNDIVTFLKQIKACCMYAYTLKRWKK